MLIACLLVAVPQTAEARVLAPQQHDGVADFEQESPFWERVWFALGSTWAKVSVLIDPEG